MTVSETPFPECSDRCGIAIAGLGRLHVGFAAALVLCLAGSVAVAGNVDVYNGEFDADLAGWSLSGPPFPAWSMLDYQGNALSGSATLSNDAGEANIRLVPLRQCVYFPGAGSYRIEAQGFLPAGHPGGRLLVSLTSHSPADCSGGTNLSAGFFLNSNGNWQYGSIDVNIISGFNYVNLMLAIEKDAAGGNLVGNIDAVRAIYRERIFANGF